MEREFPNRLHHIRTCHLTRPRSLLPLSFVFFLPCSLCLKAMERLTTLLEARVVELERTLGTTRDDAAAEATEAETAFQARITALSSQAEGRYKVKRGLFYAAKCF